MVGDVGHEPTHWEVFWRIPPQGGPQADGEATSAKEGRRVDILPAGGCDGRCGTSKGVELRVMPLENSRTVYCDQTYYRPVYGGGSETRATDNQAVVGAGRGGCGGDTNGGKGGGTHEGGGRRQMGSQRRRTTSKVGLYCSKRNLRDGA